MVLADLASAGFKLAIARLLAQVAAAVPLGVLPQVQALAVYMVVLAETNQQAAFKAQALKAL